MRFLALAYVAIAAETVAGQSASQLRANNVSIADTVYRGKQAVRLVAAPAAPSGTTFASVIGSTLRDGVIEVDLAGQPATGAGEGARGFIGIAFRMQGGDRYEYIYLRPTNGRAEDQVRRNHSTQYSSYPDFDFARSRLEAPEKYESYTDLQPGAWTRYRIEVEGRHARLYIGGAEQPCLVVNDLKLDPRDGGVALWVGPGTEGFFANLRVSSTPPAQARPSGRTWISGVTVISPERLDSVGTGSVLIEDGRIARVVRARNAPTPPGVTVVPGEGKYLIPGLIDSHVHLTIVPGMDAAQAARHPGLVDAYYRQLPRSYLYFGFTSVVDLGVAVDRARMDDLLKVVDRPDVYGCGTALVIPGGYPTSFYPAKDRERLFPITVSERAVRAASPPSSAALRPAEAVEAVRRAGGICVKTFFERGFGANATLPVPPLGLLKEIRAAATQAHLPLLLHANTFEAQQAALDAEVDIIAHGMWEWGALNSRPGLPAEISTLLDRVAERRIGYQPTMQVTFAQSVYFEPDYLTMPRVSAAVPASMLDWFKSAEGAAFKRELGSGTASDSAMRAVYERGPFRRERAVIGYLAQRNANFLFGTDTPAMPSYGSLPGLNGRLEIDQLRRAGLSPAQILSAATINNATALGLRATLGTIEPGKVANLLLLSRSPLESVDAYDSIVTVWLHGRALSREALAAPANR